MKRKSLYLISTLTTLAGGLAGVAPSAFAETTIDGASYWSVTELLALQDEVNAEMGEVCSGDYTCEQDFRASLPGRGGKYRALDSLGYASFEITAIDPVTETIRIYYNDRDKMMEEMMGFSEPMPLYNFYTFWAEEGIENDPVTATYNVDYHVDLITRGTPAAGIHPLVSWDGMEMGEFPAGREIEFSVAGSDLINNNRGYIMFTGGGSTGAAVYKDCLNSPNFTKEGMECRRLYNASGRRAFAVVSTTPEVEEPTIEEPTAEQIIEDPIIEPVTEPEPLVEPESEPVTEPEPLVGPESEPVITEPEPESEPTSESEIIIEQPEINEGEPETAEDSEPTDTPESTEVAEPTETPESTEVAEPTETPESTEVAEPTETTETAETPEKIAEKSVETKPTTVNIANTEKTIEKTAVREEPKAETKEMMAVTEKENKNETLKNDSENKQESKQEDDIEDEEISDIPASGAIDCQNRIDFPWWLVALLILGDALVVWWFIPTNQRHQRKN